MATQVTVNLPDSVYERAKHFALLHSQDMETAISTLIEQGLAADEAGDEVLDWSEPDPAVDRERAAYIALHPTLKEEYLGKYIAIYQGKLTDYDDDPAALASRIKARYPGQFVLVTRVGQEPIRTFTIRLPRIVRDSVP